MYKGKRTYYALQTRQWTHCQGWKQLSWESVGCSLQPPAECVLGLSRGGLHWHWAGEVHRQVCEQGWPHGDRGLAELQQAGLVAIDEIKQYVEAR